MPAPRRSFLIASLGFMGLVLLIGAGSAVITKTWAADQLGALPYAFGMAGVTFAGYLALGVLRALGRWPFEALADDAPPPVAQGALSYGAIVLAGLGIGAFAGLLHHLSSPVHWGTLIAYFGFLPLAILTIGVTTARLGWALLRLLALMVPVELGAQLGVNHFRGGGWWDDITGMDLGFLLGGALFLVLVAGVRRLVRGPPTDGGALRPGAEGARGPRPGGSK